MRATGPCVYHLVPPDLRGTVLYPLNQLKTIHPEIAAKQMAKYAGRAHVLQQRVPPLDCVWNDVLMFSPVHPAALKAAMEEAGHVRFPRRWFEIDAQRFTRENTALYLPGESPEEARVVPYEPGCWGAICASVGGAEAVLPSGRAGQARVAVWGNTARVIQRQPPH